MGNEGEKMRIGLLVGKGKTWLQRLQTYVSLINFFMLFYIFIGDNKWFSWYEWVVIVFIVCSLVLYIDVRYIMGNALGYQWDKNKSFKRLEKKVDMMMEKLECQG